MLSLLRGAMRGCVPTVGQLRHPSGEPATVQSWCFCLGNRKWKKKDDRRVNRGDVDPRDREVMPGDSLELGVDPLEELGTLARRGGEAARHAEHVAP